MLGFTRCIHQFRYGGLHLEGHFVGSNTGIGLGVVNRLVTVAVECSDRIDQLFLVAGTHPLGVSYIVDRIAGGIKLHTLKFTGKKTGGPLAGSDGLRIAPAHTGHDHKSRQVFRLTTETIVHPGSHGGPPAYSGAGVHKSVSRIMVNLLGYHGANDGNIVGHLGRPWKVIANILFSLSVLFKFGQMALHLEFLALQLSNGLSLGEGFGHGLPMELIQLGLVIKSFEVGRPSSHAQKNDPFRLRFRKEETWLGGIPCKKRVEGGTAEAKPRSGKKGPSVDGIGEKGRVHRLKLVSARLSTARATGVQSVSVVGSLISSKAAKVFSSNSSGGLETAC